MGSEESRERLCEYNSNRTEAKSGFISGNTFDWKDIRYYPIDGYAIFEGDIILGTVEEMEKLTSEMPRISPRAVAITSSICSYSWINGVIPFVINENIPDKTNTMIQSAIAHWQNSTDNLIRLVNRGNEPNFVEFVRGDMCASQIGKSGGRQEIILDPRCSTRNVIHEIGHTVGLWHEQSREDRDNFVRILWDNISWLDRYQFLQHITDGDDVGKYDYCSIMHYDRFAFCEHEPCADPNPNKCPCVGPTIEVLQPNLPCANGIGFATGLSDGDRAAVRGIYNWSDLHDLDGYITSLPSVATNADGRLEVFVRGSDNGLYHIWQLYPGGEWSQWSPLGGSIDTPSVAANADGRLEVFVRGSDNGLYHICQEPPPLGGWSQWSPLGGISVYSKPSIGRNADGRLEVFTLSRKQAGVRGDYYIVLYHIWQDPLENWSQWTPMFSVYHSAIGPVTVGRPFVASNIDGRLEVFIIRRGGVHHAWQNYPGGEWSSWSNLGGPVSLGSLFSPVIRNRDGRLEIFIRAGGSGGIGGQFREIFRRWQLYPGGEWENWHAICGTGGSHVNFSQPVVAINRDGRLEVFHIRVDTNKLQHKWNRIPNEL